MSMVLKPTYRRLWLAGWAAAALAAAPWVQAATPRTDLKGTIDFLVWGNADSDRIDKMVIEAFQKQYPNITVNLVNSTSNHMDKFLTLVAAGTPPDIVIIDAYDFPSVVNQGLAFDVTAWAQRDGVINYMKKELHPAAYEEMTYGGRLYSVANLRIGLDALFYNQDLFLQGGVPFPYSQGEWTWEDLKSAAIRLTRDKNGDGTPDQKGLDMHQFFFWSIVRAYGGELLNAERTRAILDEPRSVDAIQWLADLGVQHNAISWNFQSGPRFGNGDAAMHIMWVGGIVQSLRATAKFGWDITPLPAGPAGAISTVKGNPVIIPASAKNKELAWEFMKFLGGEEANYIYGMQGRFFPLHRSALMRVVRNSANLPPKSLPIITELKAKPLPLVPGFSQVQNMWVTELRPVWLGQAPARTAAVKIAEQSAVILAEAKKKK